MSIYTILNRIPGGANLIKLYRKYIQHNIFIGKDVSIMNSIVHKYTNLANHCSLLNSTIGSRSSIGRYSIVRNSDIGKYCAISWRVTIGADHHPTERISGSGAFFMNIFGLVDKDSSKGIVKRTIIGNDVLIGCHTVVISGVKVGDGAIIGSGSVVTKDVEPYQIVAGNPAKPIKMRFAPDTVNLLQQLEWWNLDDDFIRNNISSFQKPISNEILIDLINKKI